MQRELELDKSVEKWYFAEIETEVSRANFLTLFKTTSLVSIEDGCNHSRSLKQ